MKIIALSDTHTYHDNITLPEGDVLVHAGDFCLSGDQKEVIKFNKWLESLSFKQIIIIPGNHDRIVETMILRGTDPKSFFSNATLLIDESIEVDGVKFYGSPWQPEFFNWAFNLPRGTMLREKWKMIPDDTDVLITHGPPYGILDECPDMHDRSKMANVGCKDLLDEVVNRVKPTAHIMGHIHECAGAIMQNGIHFINASVCTRDYKPTNPIQVIEI